MAFKAVLDANVLFPASLRDTLLSLAEIELFDPLWSARILDEMKRSLIEDRGFSPEMARRLEAQMAIAFEDALVPQGAIDALEPAMTNHVKDRHVLAAAVAQDADAVVTNNTRHFPPEACDPHGVEVSSADEFLGSLFDLNPADVCESLERQVAKLKNPPHTLSQVLDHLEAGGAAGFADQVRQRLNL